MIADQGSLDRRGGHLRLVGGLDREQTGDTADGLGTAMAMGQPQAVETVDARGTAVQVGGPDTVSVLRGWLPPREFTVAVEASDLIVVHRASGTALRARVGDWVVRDARGFVLVLREQEFVSWWRPVS